MKGVRIYLNPIIDAFADEIDYSILHRLYGADRPDAARYSPAKCIGCEKRTVLGNPDDKHISTSHVERQNLTMRMGMGMRRFTRLTNAFSKKIENHEASVAPHFMHYTFARVHRTLRVTPAMEAGIANHIWSFEEILALAGAHRMERAA